MKTFEPVMMMITCAFFIGAFMDAVGKMFVA